ncbi:MAG: 4Fe-4S binding protein [Alphaproteobacteria bacterium]|nr:4Fe-4S binding protein [Alphaproteobacteria bacterium]
MNFRKKIKIFCFSDILRSLFISLRYVLGFGAARKVSYSVSFASRTPVLIPERCVGCRLCVSLCPTQAISVQTKSCEETKRTAELRLNEAQCVSCGLCTEACPEKALSFKGIKEYVRR